MSKRNRKKARKSKFSIPAFVVAVVATMLALLYLSGKFGTVFNRLSNAVFNYSSSAAANYSISS